MNRKPSASAGKYTTARSSPAPAARDAPRCGSSGTSSTSSAMTDRLRQHREVDQRADLRLRQDLQPLKDGAETVQPQHGIEERPVQRDRRQVELLARRRRPPDSTASASSAMASSGPPDSTSPLSKETAGKSL